MITEYISAKSIVHVTETVCGTMVEKKVFGVDLVLEVKPGLSPLQNEAHWLKRLEGFERVPRLIDELPGDNTIVTTYKGERLTKATLPDDWQDQMHEILAGLALYNCRHCDIKSRDLLIQDGQINLCDFGWASELREDISHYPACLGESCRPPDGSFDDEYSFRKAIELLPD